MKTELRVRDHSLVPGAAVVELWYGGVFIGEVTGADGPGVRVITKHLMIVKSADQSVVNVTEIKIRP